MKIFIISLLISIKMAQFASPDLSKDFGDAVKDLKEDVTDDHKAQKEAEYQLKMDDFIEETERLINEHKSTAKVHSVGNFRIRLNSSCHLNLPEPPIWEYKPIELECI